jgi:hypothetical protein
VRSTDSGSRPSSIAAIAAPAARPLAVAGCTSVVSS